MRIIGGRFRGKKFNPPGSFKGRPTTDFAREGLFNILQHRIDIPESAVLDLFAGAGGISFEFVSHGVKELVSVERNKAAIAHIKKTFESLDFDQGTPMAVDAFTYVKTTQRKFDLVFADPPYAEPKLKELPDLVLNSGILNEDGIFILEHGPDHKFETHPHFDRSKRYGHVHFSFFTLEAP